MRQDTQRGYGRGVLSARRVQHADRKLVHGRRLVNGSVGLRVPKSVIKAKCARYMQRGKPARLPQLTNNDDHTIIARYGAQYRGLVQYYLLAGDVWRLSRLHWVMVTSMLNTLAGKYDSSVSKMARKYQATTSTPYGPRKCFQVVPGCPGGPRSASLRIWCTRT
jgi:hypothetical protein